MAESCSLSSWERMRNRIQAFRFCPQFCQSVPAKLGIGSLHDWWNQSGDPLSNYIDKRCLKKDIGYRIFCSIVNHTLSSGALRAVVVGFFARIERPDSSNHVDSADGRYNLIESFLGVERSLEYDSRDTVYPLTVQHDGVIASTNSTVRTRSVCSIALQKIKNYNYFKRKSEISF